MLLLPFAFLACQDAGTLLPELQPASAPQRFRSIAEGSIAKPGQSLPIELAVSPSASAAPASLSVSLYASGDSARSKALLSIRPSTAELESKRFKPIELPAELPSGLYYLVFAGSDAAGNAFEESIPFFATGDAWEIRSVYAYPDSFLPGGEGLLDLVAAAPAGGGGWVRWTQDGELLQSGALVGGRSRLQYLAPRTEGVYRLVAELFPAAPADGRDFSFDSPLRKVVQVMVSDASRKTALSRDLDYLSRFHFSGSLEDTGRQASAEAAPVAAFKGPRVLDTSVEALGYRLGGGASLEHQALPFPALGGGFQPFALSLRIVPLEIKQVTLFAGGSAGAALELSLDANGLVHARLKGSDWEISATSRSALKPGALAEISLGLSRNGKTLRLVLGVDAELNHARINLDQAPSGLPLQPGTVKLGEGSGRFLIDEWGLYQPDGKETANWDAFYTLMMLKYGNALRFAQDFLGDGIPSGLRAEGDVRAAGGSLLLGAGASLEFPAVPLDKGNFRLELRFASVANDRNSQLSISSPGMADLVLSFDGSMRQGDRQARVPALSLDPLVCTLVLSPRGLSIQSGDFEFFLSSYQAGKTVSFRLSQGSKSAPALGLLSVVGHELRKTLPNLEP